MLLRTLLALAALLPLAAQAQTPLKIGVITPMTGPFTGTGKQIDAAIRTFIDQHGDTIAGRKIEIVMRDDQAVPDTTKRIAQEMVTRDHVDVLAGFGLTPLALAVAPIATQAQVPEIVMVASTSSIVDKSPFIVRTVQTVPQIAGVMGDWVAKSGIKRVVTIVSDYGPGADTEEWFTRTFETAGGKVVEKLRVPLANPDFAPFLQRLRDSAPEAAFVFVPAGLGSTFMKQFVERGLDRSGIKLMAMADVLDDDSLNAMGDAALGIVSVGPYSSAHPSPLNETFVRDFKRLSGMRPNVIGVSAYDGMALLYRALEQTHGDSAGPALVQAMKGMSWESPRGPVLIDPATRDIVQNIYIRKVERIDGQLYNIEFVNVGAVRDPAHAS